MTSMLRPLAIAAVFGLLAGSAQGDDATPLPKLFDALKGFFQAKPETPPATAPVASETAPPAAATAGAPLAAADARPRVALVIGNAAYKSGALANPVNDARAIAAKLRGFGFTILFYENLGVRDIGRVYREFRNRIVPGGVALVFYAGHGVQFKGQNYFPAVDSSIAMEEDVPLQSLNLNTLLDNMEEAKAGISLVFLDACRDNPFARRFRSASRGLAKVEAASGTLIHYATRPGSVAEDGSGDNGTYTEALLAQIGEPGVTVEQVLKRTTNRVVAKTNGKQEPWIEGSLRGEFFFVGAAGAMLADAPAARPVSDSDAEAWQAAKTANTAASYQAYLDAYPKGQFAVAAGIKRDALKQTAPAAPKAAENTETAFWNEVRAGGGREYYDAYLKQYPKGQYAALARLEIRKLDDVEKADRARAESEKAAAAERERQQRQAAEQRDWEQAKAADSVAAYIAFLDRHPQSPFAALAQAAKQKAERAAAEREKQETSPAVQGQQHLRRGIEASTRGDHGEALTSLSKAAELGIAEAHGRLGFMYLNGQGVARDVGEALRRFRLAAAGGDPIAENQLGYMYQNGTGVVADAVEAIRWYRKAAATGNAVAQDNLGYMYVTGTGIAKDGGEAARWFRLAAEQGNANAQRNLGFVYLRGDGIARDEAEAARWFRKAAEQGHAVAQNQLGYMYQNGSGVPRDEATAVSWYRKAAEQGLAMAQDNLGFMLISGRGTARNEVEATRWFRLAAEQGNANAQVNLGLSYANGHGVQRSENEALKWFRKAAAQGDARAQNELRRRGLGY